MKSPKAPMTFTSNVVQRSSSAPVSLLDSSKANPQSIQLRSAGGILPELYDAVVTTLDLTLNEAQVTALKNAMNDVLQRSTPQPPQLRSAASTYLNPGERALCRSFGHSEAEYLAFKNKAG